jgi:hypothetical protein
MTALSGRAFPKRKLTRQFPRTTALPTQSSKFWAKEKDRYIRQLLIGDIEKLSCRETVVYFSELSEGISHVDADDISEVLDGLGTRDIDLIIQTPGGEVDAVEKLVTVLQARLDSYRVIVPSWAKSGGTVIAMSSEKILLGVNSELGPIDPQMFLPDIGVVPCELVARDGSIPQIVRDIAASSVERMRKLARKILKDGMLSTFDDGRLDVVIERISSANSYNSHGAVIDYSEARDIGLSVEWMDPDSAFWRKVWLLYCCYDYDLKTRGIAKITEGAVNSIARR